jgi:hypothetical protein
MDSEMGFGLKTPVQSSPAGSSAGSSTGILWTSEELGKPLRLAKVYFANHNSAKRASAARRLPIFSPGLLTALQLANFL